MYIIRMFKNKKREKMKYEYKERHNKFNGKDIIIKDLVSVDGLKLVHTLDGVVVHLDRLNNDIAIYYSEKFFGRTTGTKEHFVLDRKNNSVIYRTNFRPTREELKSYTQSRLTLVKGE